MQKRNKRHSNYDDERGEEIRANKYAEWHNKTNFTKQQAVSRDGKLLKTPPHTRMDITSPICVPASWARTFELPILPKNDNQTGQMLSHSTLCESFLDPPGDLSLRSFHGQSLLVLPVRCDVLCLFSRRSIAQI